MTFAPITKADIATPQDTTLIILIRTISKAISIGIINTQLQLNIMLWAPSELEELSGSIAGYPSDFFNE
jgi:hypothetical protein